MQARTPQTHPRPLRRLVVLCGMIATGWALCGCQKPLFSDRYERTQYDRYDRSRNQYARQYVEDEFGRKEPNLWGRLSPKE